MKTAIPDGADTGPQAHYFLNLSRGNFEIQCCDACQRHQFYPRALCVHCGGTNLSWVVPSGRGVIYSFSIVRRREEAGGDYNVALVDLAEGVRMMSRIDGVALDQIRIGMEVQAQVLLREAHPAMVVFVAQEAV